MSLRNIKTILLHTTHPGNIGAAARALKNMAMQQLVLVQPKSYPDAHATARASGADDLLAKAKVCENLPQAIADCHLVIGLSARSRRISWPQLDIKSAAELIWKASEEGLVAVLYGRERTGLLNSELDRCHYIVQIPANPDYSSLNLAAAVQVVTYEIHQASLSESRVEFRESVVAEEMERFYQHLEQTLVAIDFLNLENPRKLTRRLRRLFNRARPDPTELKILRGILSAMQKKCNAVN